MTDLMKSLGLDKVESDPNNIPDGRYDGVVSKDEYVVFPNKNTYNHVITYKVVSTTEHNGAQRQEVFTIGKDPKFEDPDNPERLTGLTVTMSDTGRTWYKKRFEDLGLTQEQIDNFNAGQLTGTEVTFGVKTKDGWKNISFAEKRKAAAPVTSNITGNL